ncbi:hypothetical protein G7Z17_g9443 [Cylindrodendrum hubeiense]|uniref:Glutathione hydrolase n=1 Tax=Cylindrodendrum hubeiense TaxID=595255 RepID=A0A9P5H520_9HYPO|nr:hypothetical protein G7Z17_g9443 [Cylindrodendrum hubeiense]
MKSLLIPRALQLLLASTVYHGLSEARPASEYGQSIMNPGQNRRGAVSSEAFECTHIGKDLLAKGGNAIDAIVGTAFCVGVIAPYHAGIGGGGFMLVRGPNSVYEAIDFRETAPAGASEDMYKGRVEQSIHGGLSVAVPGEVRGLWYAHQKYGKLPWALVLEGAISVAEDGFILNADFQRYINSVLKGKSTNFLSDDPSWAKDFAKNGQLKKEGSTITRKRYANTLREIAKKGAEEFYSGTIAKDLVETIQKHGGVFELADFKHYKVEVRDVLNTTHRGYRLFTLGAPASGAVSFNILNTLEGFKKPKSNRPQDWHNYIEAMRFGYGARGKLGDPELNHNVSSFEARMLDKDNSRRIRESIDPDQTQNVTAYDPYRVYAAENHGTSHMVTADNEGYAVSLTTTVNLLFGSLIMCEKTGVVLNNEMNDFSIPDVRNEFGFEPSKENFIRPGKRPLSSITPIIIERKDGSFFATVGAAGGSRIISATTQVVWRIMSESLSIAKAVAEPRLHNQLMPNTLVTELSFPSKIVDDLRTRGHNITYVGPGLSIVQGITQDRAGRFEAGSDPRQKNHHGESL